MSPVRPPDDLHEFLDLTPLIGPVARGNGVLDAVADVVPEDFFLQSPQGGTNGADLGHDIDAVAVLVQHAGEAADLTFDPTEPLLARSLDVISHAAIYTPTG